MFRYICEHAWTAHVLAASEYKSELADARKLKPWDIQFAFKCDVKLLNSWVLGSATLCPKPLGSTDLCVCTSDYV